MKIYLSHYLAASTPGYGGENIFHCEEASSIKKGRSANSVKLFFNNHSSTHIDLPRHFDENGKTLNDYPADFWTFEKVGFLTINAAAAQILGTSDFPLSTLDKDVQFLILKTGFEKYRSKQTYWEENPGFSEELGHFLRRNFPKLKAIGFDSISLTSFQHREIGRKAHRAFLCPFEDKEPILIVEDMHLAELNKAPKSVTCSPLMLADADGVPVTVIAEI